MKQPAAIPLVCCLIAGPAMLAAETQATETQPPVRRPSWGLTTTLGYGGAGGDFSDVLKKPITGDFNIFRNRGAWRFGMGISFTSFTMKEPSAPGTRAQDEKEWGLQRTYLFATRMLGKRRQGAAVPAAPRRRRPPAPAQRAVRLRASARGARRQPHAPANGFSVGLLPGVEIPLNHSLALDVSGHFDYFSVSEYDLSPVGLPPASSGHDLRGPHRRPLAPR